MIRRAIKLFLSVLIFSAVFAAAELSAAEPSIAEEPAASGVTSVNRSPFNLRAKTDGIRVILSWDADTADGVTYEVYRASGPDEDYITITKEPLKELIYIDSADSSVIPPESNVTYYYKVGAVFNGANLGDSNVATAKPVGVLEAPRQIEASAGFSSVTLNWVQPDSTGPFELSGYNIYRSFNREEQGMRINPEILKVTTYEDTGLSEGTEYFYRVQTVDLRGGMVMSLPVSAIPYSRLGGPADVTVKAVSQESIRLSWLEPLVTGAAGIQGYNIFRSNNASSFSEQPLNIGIVKPYKDEAGRSFYYDNIILSRDPPVPGVEYFYKIVPVDAYGNSGTASVPVSTKIEWVSVPQTGILSADISQYGLPPESKLEIRGMKSVKIGYTGVMPDDAIVTGDKKGIDFTQAFRVRLNGNIGRKILVDVDYDDQNPTSEYTKISIQYQGEKEETIQEASFGDITLSLPPTRYASYSQTLFGIKGRAVLGDKFSVTAFGAQAKGISAVQEFTGNLRQKEVNGKEGYTILDNQYQKNIYYYLSKDPAHVSALAPNAGLPVPAVPVSIKPGSVLIYYDDGIASNDIPAEVIYSVPNRTFHFRPLLIGSDYVIDYKNGVVKFNIGIPDTSTMAVAFETSDGQRVGYSSDGSFNFNETGLTSASTGYTSDSAHLIQDGRQNTTGDLSHKVLNYYYLGETQIENPANDGYFYIEIRKKSQESINIPQPNNNDSSRYYEIDTDMGLLKFKAFFPFASNYSTPADPGNNVRPSNLTEDAYSLSANKSLYEIYLKYNYRVSSYRLDNSPVVYGSERVQIDGRDLLKDKDYNIFYETGEIIFIDKNLVQPSSRIKIAYEYFPFFQSFQSTVVGARIDYKLFDNLNLGSTWLWKFSSAGTTVPDARSTDTRLSTPASMYMLDGDIKLTLDKKQINEVINGVPFVDGADLPVDFSFQGEVAYSDFNPNLFENVRTKEKGAAMIDNMEGADNVLSLSTNRYSWFPASIPAGVVPENRVLTGKENVTENGHQIVTEGTLGSSAQVMLRLNYSGLTQDRWDAYRYVVSAFGENLNNLNYMEMWVYVDTDNPVKLKVDVGIISEDSNGNNTFQLNSTSGVRRDSEDAENNGKLKAVYDIGIGRGIYPENPDYWGAGNDVLDTEDMDNDGQMDTSESYYEFSSDGPNYYHPQLTLSQKGWHLVKIPLSQFSQSFGLNSDQRNPSSTAFFSIIKHVRVSIKGAGASPSAGHIKIESINFLGNSWRLKTLTGATDMVGNIINSPNTAKMNVETVNQNTDEAYTPNVDYFDYQKDEDKKSEEALKISYKLSAYDQRPSDGQPIYYTTKFLSESTGYDYQQYKKIKMDLLFSRKSGDAGAGRVMFVRLGTAAPPPGVDETNYYQYNLQMDSVPADGGWHTVEFEIDGSDKKRSGAVGSPNLRKVQYITLGFINPNNTVTDDVIYVNNIRLVDPISKVGMARYTNSALNMAGFGNLTHTYEELDSGFNTILDMDRAKYLQHSRDNRVRFDYTQIKEVPVSAEIAKTERYTEDQYRNDPTYTNSFSTPDTVVDSFRNDISLMSVPGLTLSNAITLRNMKFNYFQLYEYQNNLSEVFTVRPYARYMIPTEIKVGDLFTIPLGTNTLESSMLVTNTKTDYADYFGVTMNTQATYYDQWNLKREQDHDYKGSFTVDKLSINPSYNYKLGEEKGNLLSRFNYYYDSIGDKNYTDKYLVTKREITPKINISAQEIGIVSPSIDYTSGYRYEYTSNLLYTNASLSARARVAISKIIPVLPDITNISAGVSDSNRRYDNNYYPGSFKAFDELPFEKKWYVFIWEYFYDEKSVERLEALSYGGAMSRDYTLDLAEIKFFDRLRIAIGANYSIRRDSQTRTLTGINDSLRLSAREIYFDKVTLPGLEFLVKDQTVSGSYNYTVTNTYNPLDRKELIRGTKGHDASFNLPYKTEGDNPINGSLRLTYSRSDSKEKYIENYLWTLRPELSLNYALNITQPFTIPGWIPFLGNKIIKLDNSINLRSVLAYSVMQGDGRGDNNLSKKDIKELTADLGFSYNILSNIRTNVNLRYRQKDDSQGQARDSFKSFGGTLEFIAEF